MLKNRLNKSSLLWVLKRTKRRIPVVVILAVFSMVSSYFSVLFALRTKNVIDAAISGSADAFKFACIQLAVLITVSMIMDLLSRHLNDKLGVDLDRDMKQHLMHCILRGDFQEMSNYHSGDLVHRLNTDVATVNGALVSIATSLCSLIVRMAAIVIVLVNISWQFTAAVFGASLLVALVSFFVQLKFKKLHMQINDASGRISGFLQEVIERLLIVQALDVSSDIEKKSDELLEQRWQLQRKRKNLGLLTSAGMGIMGQAIGFLTLVWCAREMFNGNMSFGSLTATTQLASQLELPMIMLPMLIRQLISMSASAERLIAIESVPQEERDSSIDVDELYSNMESIDADALCFAYNRDNVLDNLSFTIPKNKLTVIVGQSGSGKSTLLRLLLSIYTPKSGDLFFKNSDGSRFSLCRETRKLFTYAPQGNLLLSGTLRDNLLLARPSATEEEIQEAVYISAIDDYLPSLPLGLDTPLGENASGLSEGQAQRVALARAILSQSPILLLDEVTSALDGDTERKVLSRICALKNRTCIVVTHRPAILEMADKKLSIVDGRVVDYS